MFINKKMKKVKADYVKKKLKKNRELSLQKEIELSFIETWKHTFENPRILLEDFLFSNYDFFMHEYRQEYALYITNKLEQQKLDPEYISTYHKNIHEMHIMILFDWLDEVVDEYRLTLCTEFLAFQLVHQFLNRKHDISPSQLQLVGITCVLIASKYEEIYAPAVADMVYISDNTYDREQILDMERLVLKTLDFNLGWITFDHISRLVYHHHHKTKVPNTTFNHATFEKTFSIFKKIVKMYLIYTPFYLQKPNLFEMSSHCLHQMDTIMTLPSPENIKTLDFFTLMTKEWTIPELKKTCFESNFNDLIKLVQAAAAAVGSS